MVRVEGRGRAFAYAWVSKGMYLSYRMEGRHMRIWYYVFDGRIVGRAAYA